MDPLTPNPQPLNPLPPGVHVGRTVSETLRRLPSDLPVIDDLLDGGLPRGRVSELVGPQSSGKTSLLVAFLAAATRRSEVTAYVDLADSLSPASFAAAGVDLERLVWVRPPSLKDALRCAEILLQAGGFAAVTLDLGDRLPRPDYRLPAIGDRYPPRFRLNVWPRLARAAEQSRAALIVLAPQRLTGSVAALGVQTRVHNTLWRRGAWSLFDGFEVSVTVARSKLGPPGRSGRWLVTGG
jgi:RecA/RadA recombinase